jgi:hypothetical protein
MSDKQMLRIEILPNQRFVDRPNEGIHDDAAELPSAVAETDLASESDHPRSRVLPSVELHNGRYEVCSSAGIVQTIRQQFKSRTGAKYLAFSLRSEIIWDHNLAERIVAEIDHFDTYAGDWLILSAHGRNVGEEEMVSAHFNHESDLIPTRGRKPLVLASGLLYVINMKNFGKHIPNLSWTDEVEETMNSAIALGYLDGIFSYFSAHLFPCLLGGRALSLSSSAIWIERATHLIHHLCDLRNSVDRRTFKIRLINALSSASGPSKPSPKTTFVIRTIFNRPHLLNRCLISIDYIRRSLDVPVEIVLASDVGATLTMPKISSLRELFPNFEFVFADGLLEKGVSRVRNLKAGVRASTGDRVCIIDDDDYYLTHACSVLEKFLQPGFNGLLLLNAQIVNERWTQTKWKYQKEITSYGTVYHSEEWAKTYAGVNALPLSSIVYPGAYIRQIISEFQFNYDLSEDFIFHLLVFSHRKRPAVITSAGISVHLSHRSGSDNVSTNVDRSGWCLDTGNGIYDLLFIQGEQFEDLAEVGGHLSHLRDQKERSQKHRLVDDALDGARQQIVKLKQASIRIGELEQELDQVLESDRQQGLELRQAAIRIEQLERELNVALERAASPIRGLLTKIVGGSQT